MAHELDFVGDEAAFAFVGEGAWHGWGQEMEKDATIQEIAKAAHMDWEIFRTPVKYEVVNDGSSGIAGLLDLRMFPEKHVLYRSDNNRPLSIVSPSYNIVQPMEILEFYKDLVGVADMYIETAGVLFGGRKFWAMANTGRMLELKGGDVIKGYMLLSSSCDGTSATFAQFTDVRVVCNNTHTMAMADGNKKIRVSHNRIWNPTEMKMEMGLIDESWGRFKENVEKMSTVTVPRDAGVEYLIKLFGDESVAVEDQSPAIGQKCAGVWDLFIGAGQGSTMASAAGTMWGLYNAVTETVDHYSGHRTVDAQRAAAWFGSGSTLKTRAFDLAMEMIND